MEVVVGGSGEDCFQVSKGGWDCGFSHSTVMLSPLPPKIHKAPMPRGEQSPLQNFFPRPLPTVEGGNCALMILPIAIHRGTGPNIGPRRWPFSSCPTHHIQEHHAWAWCEHSLDLGLGLSCLPPYSFSRQNHTQESYYHTVALTMASLSNHMQS